MQAACVWRAASSLAPSVQPNQFPCPHGQAFWGSSVGPSGSNAPGLTAGGTLIDWPKAELVFLAVVGAVALTPSD